MNDNKRVVVTGMGVVSCIGIGLEEFWRNLLKGRCGISRISGFDSRDYRTHNAAEVKDFNPHRFMKNPKKIPKAIQFLLASMRLALKDSRAVLSNYNPYETGAIIGTTALEPHTICEINEIRIAKGIKNVPNYLIVRSAVDTVSVIAGREFGLKGFVHVIPTACSAGNYAIGYGFDLIREGRARMVFCSGMDVFFRSIFAGFNRLFIIAPELCQPFDKNRKGTILGEGAATLIIESLDSALKRRAKIYAEVLGYALTCDAYSMTIPAKEGIKKVMEMAIENSKIKKEEVDYISAHGSGTVNSDRAEADAIREIFGKAADNIAVSSIKSMLGHSLSAASAMEAVSCCLAIRDNIVPPTVNLKTPDRSCKINIVANRPAKRRVDVAMNNSFAFGGNNGCVVFARTKRF